jgi:SseB protein N-terminal domain/SseB protein C-terminal domain
MLPIDPADGPGGGVVPAQPLPPPADVLPAQAMAYGGTFVRPGALAWGGTKDAPDGAYSSCEAVEQALAAVIKDPDRMDDLLDELSRARLWIPLPAGPRPVTDGSAVALPTVTYLGAEFVPSFTSIQRLAAWARSAAPPVELPGSAADRSGRARPRSGPAPGPVPSQATRHARGGSPASLQPAPGGYPPGQYPGAGSAAGKHPLGEYQFADVERPWQRAGDARVAPHIVVPAAALARRLPAGIGIALNPGAEASVPIYPEGVADLAAVHACASGVPVRVGHPPAEPEALLREVGSGLHSLPAVRQAARAWLSVPGQGEGLIISVTLDDPASEPAHEAVVCSIERAVAAVPARANFPIDVTFPGESEPDLVDEWVAENTVPFYTRDK